MSDKSRVKYYPRIGKVGSLIVGGINLSTNNVQHEYIMNNIQTGHQLVNDTVYGQLLNAIPYY